MKHLTLGFLILITLTGFNQNNQAQVSINEKTFGKNLLDSSAIKGIEFGAGFKAASMRGSQHNDPFINREGTTSSNNAGGINGGITNGNEILFRVVVKPTSSTGVDQTTFNFKEGSMTTLKVKGRHDTCIALRMPVIVEAATAIAMTDLIMIDRGIHGKR